jgi:CspA family cold shock protein
MAISTRIADYEVVNEMDSVFRSHNPLAERMGKIVGLFVRYLNEEDKKYARVGTGPELVEQRLLGDDLVRRWASSSRQQSTKVDPMETGGEHGLVKESTAAAVEYFDAIKGFGFVTNPEMKERVFLHQSIVSASGFQAVQDGDDLRCDVSRGSRGLYISKIRDIVKPTKLVAEALDAAVVRLFPDRGYGFVRVSAIAADALFHYSLLSEAMQNELRLGLEVRVNVRAGKSGTGYQVKQIVDFERSMSPPVSE